MKNLKDKEKTSRSKWVNVIISVLILFPLCYLVYIVNIGKAGASDISKNTNERNNTPTDSALVKLQAAIDLAKSFPNETNYINLSLEYYNNGKHQECVEASKKALEYNANSYPAYNNLCSAYNQLGLWDDAITAGEKALEVKPGDQLAQNNLQASRDGKVKQDKSILDAETLVKTSPNEINYLSLGNIYYSARKYELAIKSYKKTLTYNNKSVAAYNNICSAYNTIGNYKDAIINCEKALKIDSSYILAKNNLKIAKDNLKK